MELSGLASRGGENVSQISERGSAVGKAILYKYILFLPLQGLRSLASVIG